METWSRNDRGGGPTAILRLATSDVTGVTIWAPSVWAVAAPSQSGPHKFIPSEHPQTALRWSSLCNRLFTGNMTLPSAINTTVGRVSFRRKCANFSTG